MSAEPVDMDRVFNSVRGKWRLLVLEAQGYHCPRCGRPLSKHFATLDHTIPKSRGGKDALGNVLAMCWTCNNKKQSSMPTGCELIWLQVVNNRLGVEPMQW